jgi:P4 family phage/plasmid primase-like protien
MPISETMLEEGPLAAYLRSHHVERGGPCSLTGMGIIKGRWMIKDEDYSSFKDMLHEHLFVQNRRPLNLVEQRRPDGLMPCLVDLDFQYPPEGSIRRRFKVGHIRAFLRTYIEQLNAFFDLSSHSRVQFFVSLRPTPYESKKTSQNVIKDGIHIQSDLVLPYEYQLALRHKLMELETIKTSFANTGYMNDEKEIYDEITIRNGAWFFYGESKPDIPAYSLAYAYSYEPGSGELTDLDIEDFTTRDLMDTLSLRHKTDETPVVIEKDAEAEWNRCLEAVHKKASAPEETKEEKGAEIFPTWLSTGYTEDELVLAKKLAERCLSEERADGYQTWREVGWCLYALSSTDDMFETWMNFSKKSKKFRENDVGKLHREWTTGWRSNGRRFTIRSLHLWARNDNLAEYKKIMEDNLVEFVLRHVNNTHTHVARLMHKMFWGDFRASVNSKTTEWFEFKSPVWEKSPQALEFRNKMSTEVADLVQKAKDVTKRKGNETTNEIEAEYQVMKLKELHKLEGNLYSCGFKESTIKECVGLFYEKDFSQKLNSNPNLIGFKNGILNLRAERVNAAGKTEFFCEFREGKPEDCVSFQAGRWDPKQCDPIDYIPFRADDPEQTEIDEFMAKVFPRSDLRSYMWRKLASYLEGTNREQTYDTWIGVGGNGKSKLVDLMVMALGDYAVSMQSTVLTRKRPDSGAANPDIMAIRNRRFIYMAEPDDGEPLNTSRMKQFTGEDAVEARGLFEDQTKFQITGKPVMLCNKFPAIHAQDRGTWRRVRAVPFESKFVDPDSEEGKDIDPAKNIWPRDNFLDGKLKRWRVPFMARLVHVYETQYLKTGIEPIPAIVRQESDNYRSMFDSFGKFKQARFRTEAGSEACLKEIWRVYKQWSEVVGGKKLQMAELQKRLDDEYGVPADKKTYKRIRLFESDEDLEDWEREQAATE